MNLHRPPAQRHHTAVPVPVEVDVGERLLLPSLTTGYRNRLRLPAPHGNQVETDIGGCVFGAVLAIHGHHYRAPFRTMSIFSF